MPSVRCLIRACLVALSLAVPSLAALRSRERLPRFPQLERRIDSLNVTDYAAIESVVAEWGSALRAWHRDGEAANAGFPAETSPQTQHANAAGHSLDKRACLGCAALAPCCGNANCCPNICCFGGCCNAGYSCCNSKTCCAPGHFCCSSLTVCSS